jgi:hypothetical protein
MPLEFKNEDLILRVDGDVLEMFAKGVVGKRIPLAWLAVQVQPSIKGMLIIKVASARGDAPVYEVVPKARALLGTVLEYAISTADEPFYRQFFTEVAQACGRPVMP